MTDDERTKLRDLQDRWLALGTVKNQTDNYGWTDTITGIRGDPTFQQVRESVLPQWESWFRGFFTE